MIYRIPETAGIGDVINAGFDAGVLMFVTEMLVLQDTFKRQHWRLKLCLLLLYSFLQVFNMVRKKTAPVVSFFSVPV